MIASIFFFKSALAPRRESILTLRGGFTGSMQTVELFSAGLQTLLAKSPATPLIRTAAFLQPAGLARRFKCILSLNLRGLLHVKPPGPGPTNAFRPLVIRRESLFHIRAWTNLPKYIWLKATSNCDRPSRSLHSTNYLPSAICRRANLIAGPRMMALPLKAC